MKKIAFVYTEYQQNILLAICLQQQIRLDMVFIRNNINVHKKLHQFSKKVLEFDDIPYSWKTIFKFYNEYRSIVHSTLNIHEAYMIFTWSIEHPMVRFAINNLEDKQIHLLEDGTGSYLKDDIRYKGWHHLLLTRVISSIVDIMSFQILPYDKVHLEGWSLYDNCFPSFQIKHNLLDHSYFQRSMMNFSNNDQVVQLKKGSIVFIQQPYVEMNILSDEEYIHIHIEALAKIKKRSANDTIIWKLHPRTCIEKEYKRIDQIKKRSDIEFQIVHSQGNMEQIAYNNVENRIQYFSLGSSSLYVILALLPNAKNIYLIESEILKKKLYTQIEINDLYRSIGIELI